MDDWSDIGAIPGRAARLLFLRFLVAMAACGAAVATISMFQVATQPRMERLGPTPLPVRPSLSIRDGSRELLRIGHDGRLFVGAREVRIAEDDRRAIARALSTRWP